MREMFFSFSGRLNRKPWWLRNLALFAILIVAGALFGGLAGGLGTLDLGEAVTGPVGIVMLIVGVVLFVAFVIASLSLAARRLHDRNKSAWWLLFFYVVPNVVQYAFAAVDPTLGLIGAIISLGISIWFLVELGFLRGTDGPNRYGDDPLADYDAEVEAFA